MLVATGIALAGELSTLGLLATGGWLLLSAALRPPILLLSVAIGVVQVLSLLRGTARYAERLASHGLGLGLQADLRSWLYRRLERLLPGGLPGGDRGDLLARLISDTEEVQDLVVRAAVPVLAIAVAWLAAVATAAILLPAAGWAILAAGITGAAGVTLAAILVGRNASALPAARAAVGSWVHGVLTSGEELAALRAEEWAVARLGEREQALGAHTRAVAAAAGLGQASCLCAGGAGLAAVTWTGATAQHAGRISPVGLGVLVFLTLGVAGLLQALPNTVSRLQVSRASLERLAGLGRMPAPVAVAAAGGCGHRSGPAFTAAAAARCARSPRGTAAVALRGATIAYPNLSGPGRCPVIRDLDLNLLPGRPVALTGPSGCGKTSVVLALLRFIDLAAGRLTIDGDDAIALPPEQVRALMGWSPEQPALFPASLRANLRLGAPDATDEEITDLLARLRLGPWLDQLDRGLDTVIAPWGHPASGGDCSA
jgi:ATP-binding cassette, subfamily C, bacterial CydCD